MKINVYNKDAVQRYIRTASEHDLRRFLNHVERLLEKYQDEFDELYAKMFFEAWGYIMKTSLYDEYIGRYNRVVQRRERLILDRVDIMVALEWKEEFGKNYPFDWEYDHNVPEMVIAGSGCRMKCVTGNSWIPLY